MNNDFEGEFKVIVTVPASASARAGLPGAPKDISVTIENGVDVKVAWAPPQRIGATPLAGYRVESAVGGGKWEAVATTPGYETWHRHGGALESAFARQYRVAATTVHGAGPYSATATVTRSVSAAASEGDLALVDGSVAWEGRVEVFRDGAWGTVCDDSWDAADAAAACRQAGYHGAVQAVGDAHFGQGRGAIVLDDVACEGTEDRLVDCSRAADPHDCGHAEDAGVICAAPNPRVAPPRFVAAAAQGERVTLYFDSPLDTAFAPAPRDFLLHTDMPDVVSEVSARRGPRVVAVSIAGRRVTLRVSPPLAAGETASASYLRPALHPLRAAEGHALAASFVKVPVRNDTGTGDVRGQGESATVPAKRDRPPGLVAALAPVMYGRTDGQPLRVLDASGRKITDLSGIEALTVLEELNLADNAVEDLSPLAGLVGLKVLDLSGNRVVELWPLAGLPELERLALADNRVADAAPLALLTGLRVVDLSGNRIADLSALGGLSDLEYLALGNNGLWHIGSLGRADPSRPPRPVGQRGFGPFAARRPAGARVAEARGQSRDRYRCPRQAYATALGVARGQPAASRRESQRVAATHLDASRKRTLLAEREGRLPGSCSTDQESSSPGRDSLSRSREAIQTGNG